MRKPRGCGGRRQGEIVMWLKGKRVVADCASRLSLLRERLYPRITKRLAGVGRSIGLELPVGGF